MASNAEMIGEFREIVDGVVEQNAEQFESMALRTGKRNKNCTRTYGLDFFSIETKDARFHYIPHSHEHIWAVGPSEKGQIDGYSGYLAIVSFASEADRLFRHWTFESAMPMQHPSTSKAITGARDMEEVLDWVKSPHLNTEAFERITRLDEGEIDYLNVKFKTFNEQSAQFERGMRGANRMSRTPMRNIGPIAG